MGERKLILRGVLREALGKGKAGRQDFEAEKYTLLGYVLILPPYYHTKPHPDHHPLRSPHHTTAVHTLPPSLPSPFHLPELIHEFLSRKRKWMQMILLVVEAWYVRAMQHPGDSQHVSEPSAPLYVNENANVSHLENILLPLDIFKLIRILF